MSCRELEESEMLICGNHCKERKIQITLLIEYLKTKTLFEIRESLHKQDRSRVA